MLLKTRLFFFQFAVVTIVFGGIVNPATLRAQQLFGILQGPTLGTTITAETHVFQYYYQYNKTGEKKRPDHKLQGRKMAIQEEGKRQYFCLLAATTEKTCR